jgi:hypothetical protein
MAKATKLRIFETHGVHITGESGDQLIGYCPFTGKDDKFYINEKTFLWDSKTGGQHGNINDFLRLTADRYQKMLTPELLAKLAHDRKLPISAFTPWGIGWTGRAYSIPVRDARGKVVDIRMFSIGGKNGVISTAGVEVGLLGADRLGQHPSWPVYLCEGEWDAVALRWLLEHLGVDGVVLGLPGAGTFKPDWASWLSGRRVHTLYDHDGAGEKGEQLAYERLHTAVQLLTFVHWSDSLPEGFDVRDWIVRGAVEKKTPKKAWRGLTEMFRTDPRQTRLEDNGSDDADGSGDKGPDAPSAVRESKWKQPPTLDDVHSEFRRWLYLDSTDGIDIMLATAISQQIDGEPVWMFIVGPPGSAKTETLSSLSWVENIYMTSSVTPHSLISGANYKDGADPSLIPKLDGKVMVIKDFTSIMSMRDNEKDEIFGILRDAYDGKCGKEFGNGVVRRYESRFTVLAAVTPSIYALGSSHAALGERFLKFGIGDNLVHHDEDAVIDRAITNINKETTMRDDLADVVGAFLTKRLGLRTIPVNALPVIPPAIRARIIALARFGARMRGTVTRDTYRNDIITSRPSAEVGSRLGKQLAKLAQSLAVIHSRTEVALDDFRLVKKVMLDTIPQRTEDILRHMLLACPTEQDSMTAAEVSAKTRYPQATINRILQDLTVLDITKKVMGKTSTLGAQTFWTLSPYIRGVIAKVGLYTTEEEVNRQAGRVMVRVITRRAKRAVIKKKES